MIARFLTDLGKAAALGPDGWRDLVRAAAELARARRTLARRSVRELLAADTPTEGRTAALTPAQHKLVERVAYAVPRMGARVPWRSDCLVQALAAQRWLASRGIAADLNIGVRNDDEFAAHAWLTVGDAVVTGGPIADYAPLLAPGDEPAASRR